MSKLHLETLDGRIAFAPGSALEGSAGWEVERAYAATLRLFWRTTGKGTEDIGLVEALTFGNPAKVDTRTFRFVLPAGPLSYNGRLIAITWALELHIEPGNHTRILYLLVSPTGKPLTP